MYLLLVQYTIFYVFQPNHVSYDFDRSTQKVVVKYLLQFIFYNFFLKIKS